MRRETVVCATIHVAPGAIVEMVESPMRPEARVVIDGTAIWIDDRRTAREIAAAFARLALWLEGRDEEREAERLSRPA